MKSSHSLSVKSSSSQPRHLSLLFHDSLPVCPLSTLGCIVSPALFFHFYLRKDIPISSFVCGIYMGKYCRDCRRVVGLHGAAFPSHAFGHPSHAFGVPSHAIGSYHERETYKLNVLRYVRLDTSKYSSDREIREKRKTPVELLRIFRLWIAPIFLPKPKVPDVIIMPITPTSSNPKGRNKTLINPFPSSVVSLG
jgi:hypothetical protein